MGSIKELLGDRVYQETSRIAWRSMIKVGADLDRRILETIEAAGPDGITCQEIETRIARSHQAVSGNLRHLVERELVEKSGRHGVTSSGRKAICWRIRMVREGLGGAGQALGAV